MIIMKSKIVSGLLVLALSAGLLAGFAGTALAANSTPNIADTYTIDGITYYNVNSANFNSDKRFYVDVISKKHSSLGGLSLGDLWLMVAVGLAKTSGRNYAIDAAKEAIRKGNLSQAPTWVNPPVNDKSGSKGYVSTIVRAVSSYRGITCIVRFSDFQVGALLPADEGLYVSTTTETGSVKNVEASSVRNATTATVTSSQHITKSVAESLESTVSHSSSYSFTEGLKVGFETGVEAVAASFKVTGELSTEFTQAFEDGWSKSQAKTTSYSKENDVSVTLPPYTNVLIKQGDAETTTTTNYNCPVIIGYKVTIMLLDANETYGEYRADYTFGSSNSNARKDLNHRALEEGSKSLDSQHADWENILKDNDFRDAITKITRNVPMSGSGAKVVYTTKTTYSEVAGMAAIYPLASVQPVKSNVSFIDSNNIATMKVGNYSYTDYLNVNGYNSRGAEYYGFDKSKGRWIVVDGNMRELSGSNAPVVLEEESATGKTKFKAVNPGKCYLKYLINENAYPTGIGSNTYTKNSEIQPALLEVNVLGEEITYEITGSYTGKVGAVPESLEGDDKLTVAAYNTEDMEVERPYFWQKRELDSKGIRLTSDGIVSFTKPGTFHVRVKEQGGSIYSSWVQITAEVLGDDYVEPEDTAPVATEEAEEGTIFVVTGSYVGGVSNDRESIEGAGKLNVAAHDSTGQELAVLYSWEAMEGSDGMTLDSDGNVSFTRTGLYHVRVKSGPVYSEWVEVSAQEKAPARLIRIPTPTGNTYTGEAVSILAKDVVCEGGTAVYALGNDDSTVPTTYSSELPTATEEGTYYVWCKVVGDVNHDNSEPVCIVATIEKSGGTPSEDGGNHSSSGSGCDGGLSVLGLILSALIIRRKAR